MSAYHRAFARELQEIVRSLPVRRGDRVVDFACGDGSYSRWLARRVGREGKVVAFDISPAFLDLAQRKSQGSRRRGRSSSCKVICGTCRWPQTGFDLVWCAQSLYSLPDPVDALRRMSHAVRAGGHVCVLENDEFHHVLLPWPVELELALKKAELQSFMEQSDRPRKFYVGRDLRRAFRAAGLVKCQARSIAFSRGAPLDRASRAFFASYLEDLRRRVGPHFEPEMRGRFERLAVPGSDQYLLSSLDLTITCVNQVMTGVKPDQVVETGAAEGAMKREQDLRARSDRSYGHTRVGKADADKERDSIPLRAAPRVVCHVHGIGVQIDLQEARLTQAGRVAHQRCPGVQADLVRQRRGLECPGGVNVAAAIKMRARCRPATRSRPDRS